MAKVVNVSIECGGDAQFRVVFDPAPSYTLGSQSWKLYFGADSDAIVTALSITSGFAVDSDTGELTCTLTEAQANARAGLTLDYILKNITTDRVVTRGKASFIANAENAAVA
jgi:hypothetical protein